MISIDTVYQKVLAFANKEQRGYITPQEFNLFADQAQLEIFEQYFYDINQLSRVHGNSDEFGDVKSNIQEKIAMLYREQIDNTANSTGNVIITGTAYRVGTVYIGNDINSGEPNSYTNYEIPEVELSELKSLQQSSLMKPRMRKPVYTKSLPSSTGQLRIRIYPNNLTDTNYVNYSYIKRPDRPHWGYVVVNNTAMYDPGNKTDFELHFSEEVELVYKILKYAGISIKRNDIAQAAQGLEASNINQEKA